MDIQDLVQNLELDALRRLALELLRRQPAVFADLVNGEMVQHKQHPPDVEMATQLQHEPTPAVHEGDQQPAPSPPPTQDGSPDWCKCGRCQNMPTLLENRCCTGRRTSCITTTPLFRQLVLDANVLELAMRYREDVMVMVMQGTMRTSDIQHIGCMFYGNMED